MNRFFVILLSLLCATGAVWDSATVKNVRAGVRFFSSGKFQQAQEAFTKAATTAPGNDTIKFDKACTLIARGDSSEARELLQQAALARDTRLSSASHYNLGNLAAAAARETLGSDPVSIDPSKREEVISGLLSAVGHYRDCLRVSSTHSEARHNLELIRLFIKHIQVQWEERDRQKARNDLGLLEFLRMLEEKQRALRGLAGTFTELKNTPQDRQLRKETAESQRQLREEIAPLKQKLSAELQKAAEQNQPDQLEQIQSVLYQLAEEAGTRMLQAAEQIQSADTKTTILTQREVLDQLNEIYMVVAPFADVLQRAIPVQEGLIKQSESTHSLSSDDVEDEAVSATGQSDETHDDFVWNQSRITDWARLLSLKAEAERPQLEAQLESMQSLGQDGDPPVASSAQPSPNAEGADRSEHIVALVQSMENAIELAPKAEDRSSLAESRIRAEEFSEGLTAQQEALRLLKEIAEPLKNDQNQNDDGESRNQDQKQDDQHDQQENPGKKNDDGSDPQDQQDDRRNTQQAPSRETAESILRRARARAREHRDLEKELRKILGGVVPVDRDW